MRCADFENRLNDLLDARQPLESDAALAGHARACRDCRELWTAYGAMLAGVLHLARPEPSAELSQRVGAALRGAGADPSPCIAWPRRAAQVGGALVAMAAAVLVWALMRPGWQQADVPADAAGQLAAHRPTASPGAEREPLDHLARTAGDEYRALAIETRRSLTSALLMVPGLALSPPDSDGGQQPSDQPSRGWVDDLSDGLAPLTRSTAVALDSLWGAVVVPHEDSRS